MGCGKDVAQIKGTTNISNFSVQYLIYMDVINLEFQIVFSNIISKVNWSASGNLAKGREHLACLGIGVLPVAALRERVNEDTRGGVTWHATPRGCTRT